MRLGFAWVEVTKCPEMLLTPHPILLKKPFILLEKFFTIFRGFPP